MIIHGRRISLLHSAMKFYEHLSINPLQSRSVKSYRLLERDIFKGITKQQKPLQQRGEAGLLSLHNYCDISGQPDAFTREYNIKKSGNLQSLELLDRIFKYSCARTHQPTVSLQFTSNTAIAYLVYVARYGSVLPRVLEDTWYSRAHRDLRGPESRKLSFKSGNIQRVKSPLTGRAIAGTR
jgi:hypothetical protein